MEVGPPGGSMSERLGLLTHKLGTECMRDISD